MSVEDTHAVINNKLSLLMDFSEETVLKQEAEELEDYYNREVSPILHRYYNDVSDACANYNNFIMSANIRNRIENLIQRLQISGKITSDQLAKLNKLKIPNPRLCCPEIDLCDHCRGKMMPCEDSSALHCIKCGRTNALVGTVFEDSPCYTQEGQRSRHGSYNPGHHCRNWLDKTQAKSRKIVPEEVVDKIKELAVRDYTDINFMGRPYLRSMKYMRCSEIRGWLKEAKLSQWNDFAPQIRKRINGVTPHQLSSDDEDMVLMRFSKALHVFENTVKHEFDCKNWLYYPYGLFKTIEMSFAPGTPQYSLLECIHLQSWDTVTKNDRIWERICEEIPEFADSYIATNPNIVEESF